MDMISELPKDILGRIVYFLPQGEAVRTSVLSKSWRYIWCTRPNLDFSLDTFKGDKHEFISVVDKNLRRYCDQRLGVEEFGLCMSLDDSDHEFISLLEKWIPSLTSMGVKFRLSIRSEIQFERCVELPSVVFGAESLEDLHVQGFVLDRKAIQRIVIFKHLKSLCLRGVSVEDDTFQKIISSCPLVENLRLEVVCEGIKTIKVNDLHNLKDFSFTKYDFTGELCRIEIHPPSLEKVSITRGNVWFHKGADFRKLIRLNLYAVDSFDHFSSCKFPSLKCLNIYGCNGLKGITLVIDAPNILDFRYRGDFVASISFAATLNEWKSHIYVRKNDASPLWFLELNELLKSLSQSTISIIIDQYSRNNEDIIQENISLLQDNGRDIDRVAVESLSLSLDLHCRHLPSTVSSLINGAFCICRPRNIGVGWETEITKCLWKILMQRETGDDQLKHGLWLQDLEEVSCEINESSRVGWHQITLSELPNYRGPARFAFKWRENRI